VTASIERPLRGPRLIDLVPADTATFARLGGICALVIGVAVLCGWSFELGVLKSALPGFRPAQPLTGIVLVVSGLALYAATKSDRHVSLSWALAFLPLLIGLYALSQNFTTYGWRLETKFFPDALANQQRLGWEMNGRLSDASAVLFALFGIALLISRARRNVLQSAYVAVATMALLLIASCVVSFLFIGAAIDSAPFNLRMSIPTTLGLSSLIFGVLCLRPDLGWMRLLAGTAPAAREMRSLAIGVIALPLAFAAILQWGMYKNLYGPEVRTALMMLGSSIVLFIALLMTAARLKRIDEARQRSQEAKQRAESELDIALDAAGMSGFRYDLRTDARDAFSETGSANLPRHLQAIHSEDRARVDAYLKRQQEAGRRDYQVQYRTVDPQGQIFWVLQKGEIRYEQGVPVELCGVIIDISETVQAREALRESEERFARLAESMPQIVYVSNADGEVEYVNRRWLEYTGRPLIDRAGYASLVPREDYEKMIASWQHAFDNGEPFAAEFRLKGVDDTYRWFLTRAIPVRDASGCITRWCGTSTDIDAQKRAHEELRLVTDHADVLLAHCDSEARYVFVNKAYTRRFGLTPEDVLGKTLIEVLGSAVYERIEPYVNRALAGESVSFEIEMPYEQIGTRFMNCHYVPDIDETSRQVRGFVAAITDITERRQLEEQLREVDHRKDEFLALLAHELRNPLAPIRYAAGLLKPGVPVEISSAARDVIDRQVGLMARLLDDLLDVSRLTRNALELRLEQLDLRAIVTATVDTVRPLFEAVNHRLDVAMPAEPAIVMGDHTRLSQVLTNLLNNAAKYTEPGGNIEVNVSCEGGEFVLRVRDSGAGIAPELLPKLFELFVQGDRRMTRASGGLGVGLSLAKRLVEMHGGSIEAYSEGLGRGSTFTVRLPPAVEVSASEPRAVSENVLPIFQRRHQLLIVDDNLDAANSLAILAQLAGYVTHIAGDGLAAIEMAELVRPEAIVMDLGMPRMSGFEAARWVRQQPWGKDTVLIAVTGWGQDEDRRRSREAGFDVHLTKPVDSAALLNHLQQHDVAATSDVDEAMKS
jgi:PAS domain S-box-containing protein